MSKQHLPPPYSNIYYLPNRSLDEMMGVLVYKIMHDFLKKIMMYDSMMKIMMTQRFALICPIIEVFF